MQFNLDYNIDKFYLVLKFNKDIKAFVIRRNSLVIYSKTSLIKEFCYKNEICLPIKDYEPFSSDIFDVYALYMDGQIEKGVTNFSSVYDGKMFNHSMSYSGKLGAIYHKKKTDFYLWAPFRKKVMLRLYQNGVPYDGEEYEEYELKPLGQGVLSCSVEKDLSGIFYTYVIDGNEVVDPYAKSCGYDGIRGMVVDFNRTNPEGFKDIKPYKLSPQEMTIYETHVSDLTSSHTWCGPKEKSKLFTGFYERGTSYQEGDISVSTGFDHIIELGVNTVELLPINDAVNEHGSDFKLYNWNYNPRNYNCINDFFSANPYSGYEKIKEFKTLVSEYHKSGINIILDVVYNHVYKAPKSNFDIILPGYYFRYDGNRLSDGSGCGNEIASERKMVRKFIVDSLLFYASEYKVAGFRFDLMGLLDLETMNEIEAKLHKFDPNLILFGEPWTGGRSVLDDRLRAVQANLPEFKGYGAFNDHFRDAVLKGTHDYERGFATGDTSRNTIDRLVLSIKGNPFNLERFNPVDSINYVSCHDNLTINDKLNSSGIYNRDQVVMMSALALSIVYTSFGTAFMLAGEEFLRTKFGNHNSYNAPFEVNALDYSLKVKNKDLFDYVKKLIELRKTKLFVKNFYELKDIDIKVSYSKSMIYYNVYDEETAYEYMIIHNAYSSDEYLDLDGYELYLNSADYEFCPFSTMIWRRKNEARRIRESGILLHITSLPSKYGIGTFGKEAYDAVDFMEESGFSVWQVLPLVPTNYGDSPYQSVSSNAMNYYLIDLDVLIEKGLLTEDDIKSVKFSYDDLHVNYELMFYNKIPLLKKAFNNFRPSEEFNKFLSEAKYKDFAVFMTIKEMYNYMSWNTWDLKYQSYSEELCNDVIEKNSQVYLFWQWTQYEALEQWNKLHKYANSKNIKIMGDMPYYVAYDSVEVWKYPHMFELNDDKSPKLVGGCPPDAFSADGQLWGNPCYNWGYMRKNNYSWFNERINDAFKIYDIIRMDHFRGFDRFYAIEGGSPNAKRGRWLEGPKISLFKDKLEYKIIAEDLGIIDDGVVKLMEDTSYPGMRVIEFGFDGNAENMHLPTNYRYNTIGYTGTHDNMPLYQHFKDLSAEELEQVRSSMLREASILNVELSLETIDDIVDGAIRLVFASRSKLVMVPIQDFLHLDGSTRMNFPSTLSTSNWSYRTTKDDFSKKLSNLIKNYNVLYRRVR